MGHDEIEVLEQILKYQLEEHRKLLESIERNREAVRVADIEKIRSTCEHQNGIAQRLGELEKARLGIVGRLTERIDPRAEKPLTLAEIARTIDGPPGERLAARAVELRKVVTDVGRASAVVRAAAETLSRHMTGLTQTIQAAFGRALVYGSRGRLETGPHNQFCLDVRS